MGIKGKTDLFRDISVKLLFPIFWKSGLTANQITVFNFLTLGLASVALLACGFEYAGLLVAGLSAMVDYVDGTVARAGRGGPKGAYLDTSLDWLWLMLLIWAVSFYNQVLEIGCLAIIFLTFGNWVQYNGNVDFKLKFPFGVSHLLAGSILIGHGEWGIMAICLTQLYRTGVMYLWSLFKE